MDCHLCSDLDLSSDGVLVEEAPRKEMMNKTGPRRDQETIAWSIKYVIWRMFTMVDAPLIGAEKESSMATLEHEIVAESH